MRPTRYQLRQSPVRALAALLGSDATGRSRSKNAGTRDRTKDLQIFSLTLSQLSYHGLHLSPAGGRGDVNAKI